MSELEEYFREVSRLGLGERDDVLARVLHLDGAAREHAQKITPRITAGTLDLVDLLDFAVRVRNPGVHYVRRSAFLGYRREGGTGSPIGERSQIFLSLVPKTEMLRLVFVPPTGLRLPAAVESIGKRGHHGVGTYQCDVRTSDDVTDFVMAFETLLRPDIA